MKNRWSVYEYMKTYYYHYGRVPSRNFLEFEFPDIPKEELEEGMTEFELILKRSGDQIESYRFHREFEQRSAI